MKRINEIVTTVTFISLIGVISAASIIIPDKSFSANENRYLKDRPKATVNNVFDGSFTMEYEEYITDQFPGRDEFIYAKTLFELALQKKDSNGVYFAKDNYLIEMHKPSEVDNDRAETNKDYLTEFAEKYRNILGDNRVSIMIVPTASSTLRDKLPAFAQEYNQKDYINSIDNAIDVSNVLAEHSQEYIYYKTDHHWTSLGAYYAYQKWADIVGTYDFSEPAYGEDMFRITKVSGEFYGSIFSKINFALEPDDMYVYEVKRNMQYRVSYNAGERTSDTLYEPEYFDKKDKYAGFLGGNNAVVQIDTNVNNNRKLLVIKDSYANCFVPFAVNHYESTHVIDLRYFNMSLNQYISDNGITDILIMYNAINFIEDKNIYKVSH